jgi:enoyl-CoA hydratase
LTTVFEGFRHRDDISAVILTGAGNRVFCGGRDIKDLQVERSEPPTVDVGDPLRLAREAFWAVRRCAVPVICAVNGAAVGAGLALVAVSDIALASETATFALTEIDVGVLGAASFAQWMVGPSKARRMLYTAERVPALEIHRRGGLESVCPPEDLIPRHAAWRRRSRRRTPRRSGWPWPYVGLLAKGGLLGTCAGAALSNAPH